MLPLPHHANVAGRLHGGAMLGMIDAAIFAALYPLRGLPPVGSVTVDLQCQFVAPGDAACPADCTVELLRETRRLCFLRGLVTQGEGLVASFSATTGKPRPAPAP